MAIESARMLWVGYHVGAALNAFAGFLQCLHRDGPLRSFDENGERPALGRFDLALCMHRIALEYAGFAAALLGGPRARVLDAHVFLESDQA